MNNTMCFIKFFIINVLFSLSIVCSDNLPAGAARTQVNSLSSKQSMNQGDKSSSSTNNLTVHGVSIKSRDNRPLPLNNNFRIYIAH